MSHNSRLGPGRKSQQRGSTFANPRSELKRKAELARTAGLPVRSKAARKQPPKGRPTDEQIEEVRASECWLRQFDTEHTPCEGIVRLCHLIDKQRLRDNGVPESEIWDPRVVVPGCDHHHYLTDFGAYDQIQIGREDLPSEVEAYAEEHGLVWSLDREFGSLEDVQTGPEVTWS